MEHILLWIVFGLCILPLILSGGYMMLTGKGASLIAGYNGKSAGERAKYNEPALCRFVGKLLLITSVCLLLCPFGVQFEMPWLMWLGIALGTALPLVAVIYMNTGNRFRK
ncbi:MAG: DUF3784 domain-containing protein [Oscillospiraceae bacterium]|nr:DUF3784 domain-containing protein [Oscillospiraceae bacterium]